MLTSDRTAILRSSPIFSGLPAGERQALASVAREQTYRIRDFVFMEGDPADWFCMVVSGRIKILRQSRGGKEVVLELLGPGEPFGGVAVFERRPYPASAQAMEPTVILHIPRDPIVSLADRYPSLFREMTLMIGRRLRDAHASVASLASDPVEARLASMLLRLAEREGTRGPRGVTLPFHFTRQSLADMTGTTVETTIRVLSRWLKDGVLAEDASRLVLVDVEALRAVAARESE